MFWGACPITNCILTWVGTYLGILTLGISVTVVSLSRWQSSCPGPMLGKLLKQSVPREPWDHVLFAGVITWECRRGSTHTDLLLPLEFKYAIKIFFNYKRKCLYFYLFFSYFGIPSLTSYFASVWVTRTINSYSLEAVLQHFNDSYLGFSYLYFYSLLFHSLTLWLKHRSQVLPRLEEML